MYVQCVRQASGSDIYMVKVPVQGATRVGSKDGSSVVSERAIHRARAAKKEGKYRAGDAGSACVRERVCAYACARVCVRCECMRVYCVDKLCEEGYMANAVGDVIVQQRLTPNGKTKRKNPVRLEPAVKQNNMRKERRRKLSKAKHQRRSPAARCRKRV